MFARRLRLTRDAFPTALKGGRRLTTAHFSLVSSKEVPGYAIVVAKQVARLSTTRHRLKRQISAALNGRQLPRGLIVFARAGASKLAFADIKQEIEAGLARIA